MPREPLWEHRGTHEGENDASIAASLVSSVAAVAGVEPTALPPLQETLDTDAMEAILGSPRDCGATISFTYAGYRVTAHSDGLIRVVETVNGR